MVNKKIWLGTVILLFVLFLTGCESINTGCTFEFTIINESFLGDRKTVTKIDFINGSNRSAPVLQTELLNIAPGERSNVYKVSGFTERYRDNAYVCGVLLTFDNGETWFGWNSGPDNYQFTVYLLGAYIGI
jgi:hypothetical protein